MLIKLKEPLHAWQYTGQNLSVIRNQVVAALIQQKRDATKLIFDEATTGSFRIFCNDVSETIYIKEYLVLWPWGEVSSYSEREYNQKFMTKTS